MTPEVIGSAIFIQTAAEGKLVDMMGVDQ